MGREVIQGAGAADHSNTGQRGFVQGGGEASRGGRCAKSWLRRRPARRTLFTITPQPSEQKTNTKCTGEGEPTRVGQLVHG